MADDTDAELESISFATLKSTFTERVQGWEQGAFATIAIDPGDQQSLTDAASTEVTELLKVQTDVGKAEQTLKRRKAVCK